MWVMPETLKQGVDNDWLLAVATVSACKRTLLGQESISDAGYVPPEYQVSFSYEVNGRSFAGTFRANSPQERGHTFEILYDPQNPCRNTGPDIEQSVGKVGSADYWHRADSVSNVALGAIKTGSIIEYSEP
jgi:hypothetical protein